MLAAANDYRRKRGLPEVTVAQLQAQVDGVELMCEATQNLLLARMVTRNAAKTCWVRTPRGAGKARGAVQMPARASKLLPSSVGAAGPLRVLCVVPRCVGDHTMPIRMSLRGGRLSGGEN